MIVLFALTAMAQETPCDASFDINRMLEGMDRVDQSFEAFDVENARVILQAVKNDMSCLRDPIHTNHLVRFARNQAMAAFYTQDELEMTYWAQLAARNAEVAWPAAVPPEHPVRDQLQYLLIEEPITVDGVLAPPKGGGFVLDGQLVTTPTAAPDAPHFEQVYDKDGVVVSSYWQDGEVFREDWLDAEAEAPLTPKWWTAPDMGLDPTERVTIDPVELERRREAREAAELALAEQRERAAEALEKERLRAERRAANAERKAKKDGVAVVATEVVRAVDVAPSEWVALSFADDKAIVEDLDALEVGTAEVGCEDVRRLEPRALMGRLTDEQMLCLELELRRAERLTTKNKVSRVLMADAWAKKDLDRWQAAVRRHLDEIDRSDADLAYIFARFLAQQTAEHIPEAIRWSNVALANAHQWEGDVHVERVYALHRINAVAAQQLWLDAEARVLEDNRPQHVARANFWRNQTKALSREWLTFATAAQLDPAASLELCMSAAGTADYCLVE